MDTRDAAKMIGCSIQSVRNMISLGVFKKLERVGVGKKLQWDLDFDEVVQYARKKFNKGRKRKYAQGTEAQIVRNDRHSSRN